jgi:hypothetical protein
MAGYGIWQGANEALGKTAAAGMGLLQFQQTKEHQQTLEANQNTQLLMEKDRLEIARNQAEQAGQLHSVQLQKENLALAQAQATEAEANRPIYKESFPVLFPGMAENPAQFSKITEELPWKTDSTGRQYITNRDKAFFHQRAADDVKLTYNLATAKVSDLATKHANLLSQFNELSQKPPDPLDIEKTQKWQGQIDALKQQVSAVDAEYKRADDLLNILDPKVREARAAKAATAVSVRPGGALVNPTTGQVIHEQPSVSTGGKVPHTTIETSPDGKNERTVLWDEGTKQYKPMDGSAGEWHPAKSQVINITQAAKNAEGFASWLPEDKEQAFGYNMITGKPPVNAQGMQSNDRQRYAKEYAHWLTGKGLKAQDVSLMQSDYKAGDTSLRNMARQEAPMSAFVGNINRQVEKVQQLYDNNDRIGIRLIDLPVREIRMRAKGSGDEAVKASYLLEISNEIGKLSSGASASVQQLSDSAKEDWKRVHDPNLSFKEIMKVVNATRDQANMRITTWREAKQEVRNQLKAIGIQETPITEDNPLGLNLNNLQRKK